VRGLLLLEVIVLILSLGGESLALTVVILYAIETWRKDSFELLRPNVLRRVFPGQMLPCFGDLGFLFGNVLERVVLAAERVFDLKGF
jgi:hypothetical protein